MLGVVVLLLSAQTIYTWTDARGTVHYTDDPTSIPANVKAKTTEGEELSHTGAAPKTEAPAPEAQAAAARDEKSDEEYWRRESRAAREKVRTLEDELATDQRKIDDASRMPMTGTYYCSPGFYAPGYYAPGYGYRSRSQVGFGASVNVPLGNSGSLNINANATQTVGNASTTVVPFGGVTYGYGFAGYPGYGYAGNPCWYQMDGQSAYVRDRVERTKQQLARAKEDLADLERRAANAAVPLEWRR